MIVSKKNLRLYIRSLVESIVYGDSDGWYASEDSDWPAPTGSPFPSGLRSRYAVFLDQPEIYYEKDPSQLSHGGFSHALKHAYEIHPNEVLSVLNKISKYLKNLSSSGRKIFRVYKKTGDFLEANVNDIKPGDVLNTLDWINDELHYGHKLEIHYQRMYDMSATIYQLYWDSLRTTISGAVDVSDGAFPDIEELINFLQTKPIIKFKASFKGKTASLRVLDTSNSVLYGEGPNGKIATYFMQEKKSNKHKLPRILSFVSPIRRDGSPTSTMISDEYSNLRKIASMATKGEL